MTFTPHPLSRATRFSSPNAGALALRFESWCEKLAAADLAAVRKLTAAERSQFVRFCAILISKLGNGWIYPILAAVIFAEWGWSDGKRLILLAGVNAASMHVLYPLIKMRFKRLRPFKVDPSLPSLLKTLDEHSFPSGHAMTLTGVLAPIVLFAPGALISAVAMACCMGWSRIATGHHYPSDVAAGVALGVGLGYPLSANLAAFF